ncbi:glycoside hydrolase family 3 C-terminal domain-containing protein [Lacticaseibacillus porcinae]|uniref:glycoside hydrolase family 3 C-terminal domain-containing protein n=1 Tax=Lacticaseibacillus porcinae TaxID=1123687 RepID=UPI000F78DCE6|nr:glycoside hydrolase family 3 C-terminal domain-containing protein [Lacticaseibacillus porcinae]
MAWKKKGKKRLKMRNGWFIGLWTPWLVILTALFAVASVMLFSNSGIIASYMGSGARKVTNTEKSSKLNANYYPLKTTNTTTARQNAEQVARKVGDEGEVLLKNDGALPLKKASEVTPYGYAYTHPAYTGTGAASASTANNITPNAALKQYFNVNQAAVKAMNNAKVQKLTEAKGTSKAVGAGILSNDSTIYGYDAGIYSDIKRNDQSTALVFITRQGNEGADKKMDGYSDGTRHYLALSQSEKQTIQAAKAQNKKVVAVIVSSNAMELTPLMQGEYEADAIVWMGNPGSQGFLSLAKILSGVVDPSGRLSDTYASDFTKDPTYQNMGEFNYTNVTRKNMSSWDPIQKFPAYYLEYQEGIYSGYRYYETAAKMDKSFTYGSLTNTGAIKQAGAVAYPFGYGLSYTSFNQHIAKYNVKNGKVQVAVSVQNTGKRAGKDVVQLYYSAPYTKLDQKLQIEKSDVNLAAFSKTKSLAPGETQTLKLSYPIEDMASYAYLMKNDDGSRGAYMLDAGNYGISLRNNSHDVIDTKTYHQDKTIWYNNKHPRQSEKDAQVATGIKASKVTAATNQFQQETDYMRKYSTIMSRTAWDKSFPKQQAGRQKAAGADVVAAIKASSTFNYKTDQELGNVKGSKVYSSTAPKSGEDNDVTLSDLRGKSYNDPEWDKLLNQIDYSKDAKQISKMLFASGYTTSKLNAIGKPTTWEQDGDTGLKFRNLQTSSWMSKPVFAATWNQPLIRKVGQAIGQEALTAGLSGWYAPGMNIHRSPFAGRNLEYFSEDPVLTGKMAASEIGGAGDEGLYTFIKHFALNDEETNRQYFLNTWADEQTMREVYLKGFEIAVKSAKMHVRYTTSDGKLATKIMPAATGLMTTQSCVGTTPGYANYALQTAVLRKEWGFTGTTITDLIGMNQNLMDQMTRAGGDLWLMMSFIANTKPADTTSPTALKMQRRAIHDLAYTTVNSAVFNGVAPGAKVHYAFAWWQWLMIGLDFLVAAFVIFMIWHFVRRIQDAKQNPERYKHSRRRAARA